MARFILRIDDCGWRPGDKADDRGLEYFRQYRAAAGLEGLPVYYGFIPTTIGLRELDWLIGNLSGGECVSVHGYDHADGAVVNECQMKRALRFVSQAAKNSGRLLPSYIPPFNRYDASTIEAWQKAAKLLGHSGCVFFGGFPDDTQSVNYGRYPALVNNRVLHIPACRDLYGRASELLPRLDVHILEQGPHDPPEAVTLHATWDHTRLKEVGELVARLKPHLVGAEAAFEWLEGRRPQA